MRARVSGATVETMRVRGIALVVVLALGGGIGTATGTPLTTASGTATVIAGNFGVARAVCKQGTTAVAGGFETQFDPTDPASPRFAVAGNRRSGRTWYVSTRNVGAEDGALTAFAACRDEHVRLAFEKTTVAGGTEQTVLRARCTEGTKAVSGGFYGELNAGGALTQVTAHRSRRLGGRSWEVAAGNVGGDEGGLLSFVYCHDGKALRAVEKTVPVAGGAVGFTVTDVVAPCQRGTRVISGGFDAPPALGDQAIVLASRPAGKRSWLVRVATALPVSTSVSAYAYCEER